MKAVFLLALMLQLPLQEAVTLVRQGRYQEAEEKLRQQPEPIEKSQRVAYHRLRAAIDAGLHRLPAAAAEMKQALALAPHDDGLIVATAFALIESGANQDALRVLETADDTALALTLRGIASYAQGEFKEAEAFLNAGIERDANFEPAYRSLAQIVLSSSNTPRPRTMASLCRWDVMVCHALNVRQARSKSNAAQLAASIAALRKAAPDNSVARCALGQAYSWNLQWTAARPELEACVKLNPSPQHHYQLAMAYQHLGEKALARQQLEERTKLLGAQSEESLGSKQALEDLRH